MLPCQLYDNLDTRSLYKERPYGRTFRNPLTITRASLLVQKSTAYTAVLATLQPKSYIKSLDTLDTTMLTGRQLTI